MIAFDRKNGVIVCARCSADPGVRWVGVGAIGVGGTGVGEMWVMGVFAMRVEAMLNGSGWGGRG